MSTWRYICTVCMHQKEPQKPSQHTSEHVKSQNFLGECPQTPPHTIHFVGPHFLYLPWAPPILSVALLAILYDSSLRYICWIFSFYVQCNACGHSCFKGTQPHCQWSWLPTTNTSWGFLSSHSGRSTRFASLENEELAIHKSSCHKYIHVTPRILWLLPHLFDVILVTAVLN